MKISIVQTISDPSPMANMDRAAAYVKEAAQAGSDLVAFPEYLDSLGALGGIPEDDVETLEGPQLQRLAAAAKEHGIWVLVGSMREKSDDPTRHFNTSVLVDRQGQVSATYRKIHLFDAATPGQFAAKESNYVLAGEDVVTAEVDDVVVGLSICYDLRFPELYRRQAERGARILFAPSAFTAYTGKDHWEVLLRARAIENQCFVVAPGQYGTTEDGRTWHGRSMVIDPWGVVLACAPDGAGMMTVDLDLEVIDSVREQIPSLSNRRLPVGAQ